MVQRFKEILGSGDSGEPLDPIQGKVPDSKEEVWVAKSLYKYGVAFIFQYSISGGRSTRGGFIIDFVLTKFNVPLEVYGNYWHENELPGRDVVRMKAIEMFFGVKPLILWAGDVSSQEDVDNWIRKNVAT